MHAENTSPVPFDPLPFILDCRGRTLDCRPHREAGAHVMGILNVTPDSFFDGGKYVARDAALRRTEQILTEGAVIVDVGGESSRPSGSVYGEGAEAVAADEELRRVLPIVEAVADRFPEALISVDTYKPEVVRAVLDAGAHIINDITGLRYSTEPAEVAAAYGAPVIVMHSRGKPGSAPEHHEYVDIVDDVLSSLRESTKRAQSAGVQHVVIDPGFGFGKTPRENLTLLREVQSLLELGRPVLIGVSRKSTIGAVLGSPAAPAPVDERLFGSLGATAVAVMNGASIVRTHDVAPTVEMLSLIGAVMGSGI